MYSISLESEEMEDMESDEKRFCGSERGYRFESKRSCLILVVDIRSFAVAVNDIAESRVTSTIGTCNSMHVFGARMLDTGTYSRNTLGHTYSCELDGDGSDHHDGFYFEIDSDKDDPDSPSSGSGSLADRSGLQSEPSQFDAAGHVILTKHIDAVRQATFMRLELKTSQESIIGWMRF